VTLIDTLRTATDAIDPKVLAAYDYIIVTNAQFVACAAEPLRVDFPLIGVYRPNGTRASRQVFLTANMLSATVVKAELGDDISAFPNNLDLRSAT
jgi:hypothetical protein